MPNQASTAKTDPTIADKVRFLSRPDSYPHSPSSVDVIETHMSWVFLAGELVYKLKKPVCQALLDLRSLERREANVEVEIRLNRRLASEVYLGAQTLRQTPEGTLALNGAGRIIDWLVEMRRLPEERTLKILIESEEAGRTDLERLAETLIGFYAGLPPEDVAAEAVSAHYEQEQAKNTAVLCDPQFGLDAARLDAALLGFEVIFNQVRPILQQRVGQGRFVEGHGDLRLEHVFMTEPVAIIDCLEFSKSLRIIDPFEEISCLGLEAALLGADWVFPVLCQHMEEGLEDRPPPMLLEFYWRYRALLRARFALLHLTEPVIRAPKKWRPLAQHYIALSEEAEIMTRLPEGR